MTLKTTVLAAESGTDAGRVWIASARTKVRKVSSTAATSVGQSPGGAPPPGALHRRRVGD
ncbi:hypothetical protein [Streptomyces sp. ISL-100]|uniref:hypothetical protein n=1 Tax=Streptomyces sp. ISL-100 TaxID=2819173 RepID=UPI001BE626DF|nr:hypothetical protein [Streptomyces sp. ISL-100]MBT2400437.1 hypothetical protein [Streptomyces sp. ISL-100]